jgi:hypothetical protein
MHLETIIGTGQARKFVVREWVSGRFQTPFRRGVRANVVGLILATAVAVLLLPPFVDPLAAPQFASAPLSVETAHGRHDFSTRGSAPIAASVGPGIVTAQNVGTPRPTVRAPAPDAASIGSISRIEPNPQITRPAPASRPAALHPTPDEAKAIARAAALIRQQGDVKGARLVLERALEGGSEWAAFALAETYDPGMLSAWKTFGIRAEPIKARELYARAQAAGVPGAKQRAEALK